MGGFLHALECEDISKLCIKELHYLNDNLFYDRVIFIYTIKAGFFYRRKKYASYMVNVVKKNSLQQADLIVEATKKGKKFWSAVGFINVQRTPCAQFMICPKGSA